MAMVSGVNGKNIAGAYKVQVKAGNQNAATNKKGGSQKAKMVKTMQRKKLQRKMNIGERAKVALKEKENKVRLQQQQQVQRMNKIQTQVNRLDIYA